MLPALPPDEDELFKPGPLLLPLLDEPLLPLLLLPLLLEELLLLGVVVLGDGTKLVPGDDEHAAAATAINTTKRLP